MGQQIKVTLIKRCGRDSNPRGGFPPQGLAGLAVRPTPAPQHVVPVNAVDCRVYGMYLSPSLLETTEHLIQLRRVFGRTGRDVRNRHELVALRPVAGPVSHLQVRGVIGATKRLREDMIHRGLLHAQVLPADTAIRAPSVAPCDLAK